MKRTLTTLLFIGFIVLKVNLALAAVDSVDILIKALVEKGIITEDDAAAVRAEIGTIRQDEEEKRKSFNVTGKRPIKLSGYIQERYVQSKQEGFNDSLEARRVRLALSGDATPNVDFKLQVDFAGSRKALTDAKLTTDPDPTKAKLATKSSSVGKPALLDAVFGYKLAGDNKLSIGQFKVPFGLENLTSSTNLDTINRSQVTEALVPGRDIGSQGRDIGVQLAGTKSLAEDGSRQIEYTVGLFNGAGINVGDDNGRKDPAARLVWKPGVEGLSLGLAHYNGAIGSSHSAHVRTGGEAVFLYGPWAVRSEYIRAKDGAVKKKGWYATVVKQIGAASQAVVRYDRLDSDTSVGDDASSTLTLGLNWFLNKDGYTRWQLNYERRREEGAQVPNDLLLAQYQAGF